VLYFKVNLFGVSELENYKYYNSIFQFLINLSILILKLPFLKFLFSEKLLNKCFNLFYFKVAND
jgi:hypothetical protein